MFSQEKYLIIIEDESLVHNVTNFISSNPDTIVVAFSLPAKIALNNNHLHSYYPEEVTALQDLDKMGNDNMHLVDSYCSYLDDIFIKNVAVIRDNKLDVFTEAIYQFKIFFDTIISTYSFLCSFFNDVSDRKILVYKTDFSVDYFEKNKRNIVTSIIEHLFCCKYPNIMLCVEKEVPLIWNVKKVKKNIKQIFSCFTYKYKLLVYGNKTRSNNALVLFNTHDVALLSDAIYFHYNLIKVDIGDRDESSSQYKIYYVLINNVFDNACLDSYYRSLLTINGRDLTDFFTPIIKSHILIHLLPYLSKIDDIKNKIAKIAPAFLLTSFCRLDIKNAFLMSLIKSMAVPVIVYQEGGGAGYLDWPLFKLDVNQSDYFLVYGDGVRDSSLLIGKSVMVPVGSIRLLQIRTSFQKKSLHPQVVYVILDRLKDDVYQHYPNNGGFFSVAYKNQIRIIEILKLFPDIHFVIKTVKELLYLYVDFQNIPNISITTEAMEDILQKSSGFIVEYPSTVFQEALLTDMPVALLSTLNSSAFYPTAYTLLKKRVHICHHPDEYYNTIYSLLEEIIAMPLQDKEFRDSYCIKNNSVELLISFFSRFQNSV